MAHLALRLAAFSVDSLLALMLSGLALLPLWILADPHKWTVFNPVPLVWALCVITLGLVSRGATPGKRWLGLQLEGTGCLICRELRRVSPVIIAGLAELLRFASSDLYMFLMLMAAAVILFQIVLPVLRSAEDLAHNTTTDFRVTRRR